MALIDLIFSNNIDIISKHGVRASFFRKCQQNIIFDKIEMRVFLPSVYVHVWDYSQANAENVKKTISNFDGIKQLNFWMRTF